jgi:hypothetical protein
VWLTSVILATQEAEIRRIEVQSQHQANSSKTLSWKNPSQKKCWQSGWKGECLLSKCETLTSNASATKKKKNKRIFILLPTKYNRLFWWYDINIIIIYLLLRNTISEIKRSYF